MISAAKTAASMLRNQGDGAGLGQGLVAMSRDTFTRMMDGRITSWPAGMERRYGFSREHALGQNAHRLLRTIFPGALLDIEATLLTEHSWQGGLIHRHADGRAITVMSQWVLHRHGDAAEDAMVTEMHSDTISIQLADLMATLADELSQPLTAISNYVNGARRTLLREPPDPDRVDRAMALAADQLVRSAEHVKLLRSLAIDLRSIGHAQKELLF
jgi:signal transduction histidine kinase